jgi:hypothetical protein
MTELKTLKDIDAVDLIKEGKDTFFNNIFGKQIKDRHISEFMLKQEAIKWVKARKFLPVPEFVKPENHYAYMHGERKFIMHFFNLTEEDLK